MSAIARSVAGGRRSVRRRNIRLLAVALTVLAVLAVGVGAYARITAGPSGQQRQQRLNAECAQLLTQAESWPMNPITGNAAADAAITKDNLDGLQWEHGITGCPGS